MSVVFVLRAGRPRSRGSYIIVGVPNLRDALREMVLPALCGGGWRALPCPEARALRAPAGGYFDLHTQTVNRHNYFEGFWLLSGAADYRVGAEMYALQPGDFCLLPPLTEHNDLYNQETATYSSLWVSYWPGSVSLGLFVYEPVGQWHMEDHHFTYAPPTVGSILLTLQNEYGNDDSWRATAIQGLLIQLAATLLRALESNDPSAANIVAKSHLSYTVLRYLQEHHTEPISLRDVARAVYLSPNYVATLFKQETGSTIFEALARIRIQRAAHLLLEEQMPLARVAKLVGYSSVDHFSRAFRRIHGLPPSRYGQGK